MSNKKPSANTTLVTNRKARHNYTIIESFEAGLVLKGTEVKSIREAKCSLDESFAMIEHHEVWIHQLRIEPYSHGNQFNHDPLRLKKALLHRTEIKRLIGQIQQKGYTLIPLKLYTKRGKVKIALGLGKGKDQQDKRESLKKRTTDREMQRAMRNR